MYEIDHMGFNSAVYLGKAPVATHHSLNKEIEWIIRST